MEIAHIQESMSAPRPRKRGGEQLSAGQKRTRFDLFERAVLVRDERRCAEQLAIGYGLVRDEVYRGIWANSYGARISEFN